MSGNGNNANGSRGMKVVGGSSTPPDASGLTGFPVFASTSLVQAW